jgi:transcriptional regulator MraZ
VFLGKFSRTIDSKNRFSVPAAFRDELTGGAYMTQGFDRNLQVLPAGAFQEVYRRARGLNIADPLARMLLRLFLGNAVELALDDNTAFTVPQELKAYANLGDEAILIGQGDYFEIWAPEQWSQQEVQLNDAEQNASRFSALTVTTR